MAKSEHPNPELLRARLFLRLLLVLSFVVLLLRVHALRGLGLADVEALFVGYALHPQPAYAVHPGLVGVVMRWIAAGDMPSPGSVHLFAAALATLVPWVAFLGARGANASWAGALAAALACATLPAFVIGHSFITPDLLLALAWPGAIGCAALGLRSDRGTWAALLGWLGAGTLGGLCVMSHAVGGPLVAVLLGAAVINAPRPRWKNAPLWAAGFVVVVLASPVVGWEIANGFSHVRAGILDPKSPSAISHAAWVLGGLPLLLTPFPLVALGALLHDANRRRNDDRIASMLWAITVWATAIVLPVAVLMRESSPSWLLPPLVPLVFHLARRPEVIRRWLTTACIATALGSACVGWIWVKTDLPTKVLGPKYAPLDVSNQLHAWGPGRKLLIDALEATLIRRHELPTIVGVDQGTCAQAQATVGHQVRVGCVTLGTSDFDDWLPSREWYDASGILLVYDDRIPSSPTVVFPNHTAVALSKTDVRRGGNVVRTIRVIAMDKVRDIATQ